MAHLGSVQVRQLQTEINMYIRLGHGEIFKIERFKEVAVDREQSELRLRRDQSLDFDVT
ncbi:hypothetical protein N9M66_04240 [Litoreibacter sp.]|nr:hypothetical protein [Litoreibacter sp.]